MELPEVLRPIISANTGETACRVVLGLTAYLFEPRFWASEGTQSAFKRFLELAPSGSVKRVMSSTQTSWSVISERELSTSANSISAWHLLSNQPRHGFFAGFADAEPNCPSTGFSYREVDPGRTDAAAVIELTLPYATPPQHLLQFAEGLAGTGHVAGLVGGFVMRFNPANPVVARDQFLVWSQRFLGIDVQDAAETARLGGEFLPSTNWLTLAHSRVLTRHGVTAPSHVRSTKSGPLFVAGDGPVLGDLNRLGFPEHYADVARRLEPLLAPSLPHFLARFEPPESMRAWQRRFLDTKAWPLR